LPTILVAQLRNSRYDYVFADAQIPLLLPYYQTGTGPAPAVSARAPTTRTFIRRYDRVPWAAKIFSSDHLAIYRIDFRKLARALAPQHAKPRRR
jgi:hypothetical protein